MNGRARIAVVYRKELRETFRDRRTVIGVVVSPLLITPLLFMVLGVFIASEGRKMRTEVMTVGIVGKDRAPTLMRALGIPPNLRVESVEEAAAEEAIRTRKLRAVAVLPRDGEPRLASSRSVEVRLMLDAGNDKSTAAAQRLRAALQVAGSRLLRARLRDLHLPSDFASPFIVKETPIRTGGGRGTLVVAGLLPYLLALACFSSGIYAANDTVAGEKERGTLETLLVSPATRRELVMGKFLAVAAVCCVGSVLSVAGMSIPFFSGLKVFAWLSQGGIRLSATGIAVTILMQLPLAFLFAGMLLTVSTLARNQKEAQTYLGPMMMAIIVPAMMSMVAGAEAPRVMAVIPILNASLIIKQALSGTVDPVFMGLALATSLAYAGLAVAVCTRLFERESVLLRT